MDGVFQPAWVARLVLVAEVVVTAGVVTGGLWLEETQIPEQPTLAQVCRHLLL